jgi:NADH:ubiquinone oxidoreductase subunit F (NADH-binding)
MPHRIIDMLDMTSLKLLGVTLYVGLFTMPNTIIGWVAFLAGVSTVVYNGIRIYKELKKRNHDN